MTLGPSQSRVVVVGDELFHHCAIAWRTLSYYEVFAKVNRLS